MLVKLISIERIIISSILIALTITEWGFKSKISKDEKERIISVNSVNPMDPMSMTQDISGLEDLGVDENGHPVRAGKFDPNYDSGDNSAPDKRRRRVRKDADGNAIIGDGTESEESEGAAWE